MGKPMTGHLMRAGHQLVVHDRNPVDELVRDGAERAANPREVAEESDIVITMLPDSPHVREVVSGEDGILAGASSGQLVEACNQIVVGSTSRRSARRSWWAPRPASIRRSSSRPAGRVGRKPRHRDEGPQLPRARLQAGVPHRPAPQGPRRRAGHGARVRAVGPGDVAAPDAGRAAGQGPRRRRSLGDPHRAQDASQHTIGNSARSAGSRRRTHNHDGRETECRGWT
jgi:hypothetical protein